MYYKNPPEPKFSEDQVLDRVGEMLDDGDRAGELALIAKHLMNGAITKTEAGERIAKLTEELYDIAQDQLAYPECEDYWEGA